MQRRGTTLIEVVVTIWIVAAVLLLIAGSYQVMQQETKRVDVLAWHRFTHYLERERQLRVQKVTPQRLQLLDLTTHRSVVLMSDAQGVVRMNNAHHQGYHPILTGVRHLVWQTTADQQVVICHLQFIRQPVMEGLIWFDQ